LKAHREEIGGVITIVFHEFLGYGVTYQADHLPDGIAFSQPWHCHNADETVIPMSGWAYLDLQGEENCADSSVEIKPGWKYMIRAGVRHRLRAKGGLFESFLPAGIEEALSNETLPERFDATSRNGIWEPWATSPENSLTADLDQFHHMNVKRSYRPGASGPDVRIEVDPAVPGTGLGRKVYRTISGCKWKMACPHMHNSSHLLVCIAGRALVGVREQSGMIININLTAGDIYNIPPNKLHQMQILPFSIVGSYFPASTWLSTDEELEIANEDWFL
jgi:mannose-6-phosphate isomerase-like protein (cupin superfamily)